MRCVPLCLCVRAVQLILVFVVVVESLLWGSSFSSSCCGCCCWWWWSDHPWRLICIKRDVKECEGACFCFLFLKFFFSETAITQKNNVHNCFSKEKLYFWNIYFVLKLEEYVSLFQKTIKQITKRRIKQLFNGACNQLIAMKTNDNMSILLHNHTITYSQTFSSS